MKRILWTLIVVFVLVFGFILSGKEYDNKKGHSVETFDKCISAAQIGRDEITDTTFVLRPDTTVALPWIFSKVSAIQGIGRGKEVNFYKSKTETYFLGLENVRILSANKLIKEVNIYDFFNMFVKNGDNDTIFIAERINDEGEYSLRMWNDLDSVYKLFGVDRTRTKYIDLISMKGNELKRNEYYPYIASWRKDELKEVGKTFRPGPNSKIVYSSNPYSICATRIIINKDSIIVDLVKFYEPYELENY